MRLVTTFIQNTESTDPDLSYLNRARFVLSVADGHGSDGVGILDAVIRNRHLFLSMTSGAEIDAGSVFTEDDLPVASDSRLGIAAFDPAYFSILAGKVSLRGDLDFGLNETQLAEYLTANKYATQAWVAAQGFIGSDGLALYATKEWVLGQNFAKASSLGNYLLKSVWDEVFEVTTVNGVRVLNVKLDIAPQRHQRLRSGFHLRRQCIRFPRRVGQRRAVGRRGTYRRPGDGTTSRDYTLVCKAARRSGRSRYCGPCTIPDRKQLPQGKRYFKLSDLGQPFR